MFEPHAPGLLQQLSPDALSLAVGMHEECGQIPRAGAYERGAERDDAIARGSDEGALTVVVEEVSMDPYERVDRLR